MGLGFGVVRRPKFAQRTDRKRTREHRRIIIISRGKSVFLCARLAPGDRIGILHVMVAPSQS